uniref:Uncharacterized protein n=1 Tax=Arundo donax TaxID=35708 RepID=A0A0A8ZXI4_ARUDO
MQNRGLGSSLWPVASIALRLPEVSTRNIFGCTFFCRVMARTYSCAFNTFSPKTPRRLQRPPANNKL